MELRHYQRILQRSWPLVVGLPALVILLTLALALLGAPQYEITASILVTQRPIASTGPQPVLPNQDNWNSWAASEYVVDDILQVVETGRFAADVAARLQAQHGIRLDPMIIQEGVTAERRHRMIYLTAIAGRADLARLIVVGAATMIEQK